MLKPSIPSTSGPLDRFVSMSPSTLGPLDRLMPPGPPTHPLLGRPTPSQRKAMILASASSSLVSAWNLATWKSLSSHFIISFDVTVLSRRHKYAVYSEFIRRAWIQLPELVRLLRGESEQDPRPNKALEKPVGVPNWEGYRYRSRWNQIILNGVTPESKSSFTEQVPAARALDVIIKHLRTGQDSNRYLILAIDLLPQLQGITCSPFGAVQKGEADLSVDARIIHDLSYPPGDSVNDNTVPESEVEVCYDGPDALANRILDVADLYPSLHRMMTGDDASDQGLCALFPAHRQYLQVKFTVEELELIQSCNDAGDNTFRINVRQLLSAVFASLLWVAWKNRKLSRNGFAQMLLRILGLSEGALLRAGALAQSSRKHYSRAWGQWVAWCSMMRFSPWLTATDTDKNAEQLVRWFHRNTAGYNPGVNASHAILLRGIRRFTDPVVKQ
ncbi:hypothetical protein F443_02379 [Phytophthora nicotianae P1569]|uniref:Uncharacterized protein n=1 Tax=Phytophthora nicotianae P1569 TaxID=1317065 RepID=V9FTU8_PHYNI|nr:hypothetical protein F443_02379 [Phytophthora nicotianae P1569]